MEDPNFPRARTAAEEGLHGAFGFPIRIGADVFGVLEFFVGDYVGTEPVVPVEVLGGRASRVPLHLRHLLAALRHVNRAPQGVLFQNPTVLPGA